MLHACILFCFFSLLFTVHFSLCPQTLAACVCVGHPPVSCIMRQEAFETCSASGKQLREPTRGVRGSIYRAGRRNEGLVTGYGRTGGHSDHKSQHLLNDPRLGPRSASSPLVLALLCVARDGARRLKQKRRGRSDSRCCAVVLAVECVPIVFLSWLAFFRVWRRQREQ